MRTLTTSADGVAEAAGRVSGPLAPRPDLMRCVCVCVLDADLLDHFRSEPRLAVLGQSGAQPALGFAMLRALGVSVAWSLLICPREYRVIAPVLHAEAGVGAQMCNIGMVVCLLSWVRCGSAVAGICIGSGMIWADRACLGSVFRHLANASLQCCL